jgi:o-succinylbenzoate---CoA ligase
MILAPRLHSSSLRDLEKALQGREPLILISPREQALQKKAERLLSQLPKLLSTIDLSEQDLRSGLVLLCTSGSMSQAAWVVHSQARLRQSAAIAAQSLHFTVKSRWRLNLPLYHVGGLGVLLRTQEAGARLLLADDEEQETHISLVPTQLQRLVDADSFKSLLKVECLLLGGAPLDNSLRRACFQAGVRACMSYGMSETGALIAHTDLPGATSGQEVMKAESAGRLLSGWQVRIAADQEIYVRGDAMALAKIDLDAQRIDPLPEWLPTGDLGELDSTGSLLVQGRKGNLIISGGENIRAEEVEEALRCLSYIQDALVFPVEDREFGQRVLAFVSWRKASETLSLSELRVLLDPILASFKHPVRLMPWPEHSKGLKVSRAFFRELLKNHES